MKTAKVVIGSGFGDEGKGLLTDHYATPDTTVVRYSSGGNAGHTVVRNGRRHVFHHFGSGTLNGATTFLSRFFISNPILYFRELHALNVYGTHPIVRIDPASPLTVPFDMMINQMVEEMRGDARHGSCGLGINETMQRTEAGFPLFFADLSRPAAVHDLLVDIRTSWVPMRLAALGITPTEEWQARLAADDILDTYEDQCADYRRQSSGDHPLKRAPMIFEGAQGLLLDQDHYFFPHVTHSHTGLHNVVALADDLDIDALDVTYVTRAYATRHGAGPFPREVAGLSYPDATNVTNAWQGSLRFGHLDLDLLAESIQHDLTVADRPIRHGLAMTCLDQVGDSVAYWQQNQKHWASPDDLVQTAAQAVGAEFCLTSLGPEAIFVEEQKVYMVEKA